MTNKISAGLIGELLLGEQEDWYVGVCTVTVDGDYVHVLGENDHKVGTVDTNAYYVESWLTGDAVVDLPAVADEVNAHIDAEHEAL